ASRGCRSTPLGTVAVYGPDDQTTTKIAAGGVPHDGAQPILKRGGATGGAADPQGQQGIDDFFPPDGGQQGAEAPGNPGCPHEEGEDFPHGEDCPFCPFWKGKQGSNRRD